MFLTDTLAAACVRKRRYGCADENDLENDFLKYGLFTHKFCLFFISFLITSKRLVKKYKPGLPPRPCHHSFPAAVSLPPFVRQTVDLCRNHEIFAAPKYFLFFLSIRVKSEREWKRKNNIHIHTLYTLFKLLLIIPLLLLRVFFFWPG